MPLKLLVLGKFELTLTDLTEMCHYTRSLSKQRHLSYLERTNPMILFPAPAGLSPVFFLGLFFCELAPSNTLLQIGWDGQVLEEWRVGHTKQALIIEFHVLHQGHVMTVAGNLMGMAKEL